VLSEGEQGGKGLGKGQGEEFHSLGTCLRNFVEQQTRKIGGRGLFIGKERIKRRGGGVVGGEGNRGEREFNIQLAKHSGYEAAMGFREGKACKSQVSPTSSKKKNASRTNEGAEKGEKERTQVGKLLGRQERRYIGGGTKSGIKETSTGVVA